MNIKLNTLKTLFLASVFLTNTAMAAGVADHFGIEIPNTGTATDHIYTINADTDEYVYMFDDDIDGVTVKSLTANVSGDPTVEGYVYLVYGDAVVDGDVELNLSQGTFYGDINVVGSEVDGNYNVSGGTVTGDVVVNITGGTYYDDIYAGTDTNFGYLGNNDAYGEPIYEEYAEGSISGSVTVNLSGNDVVFGEVYEGLFFYTNGSSDWVGFDSEASLNAFLVENEGGYFLEYDVVNASIGGGDLYEGTATLNINEYNTTGTTESNLFEIRDFDIIDIKGGSNVYASLKFENTVGMLIEGNSNVLANELEIESGTSTITVVSGSSLSINDIEFEAEDSTYLSSLAITGTVTFSDSVSFNLTESSNVKLDLTEATVIWDNVDLSIYLTDDTQLTESDSLILISGLGSNAELNTIFDNITVYEYDEESVYYEKDYKELSDYEDIYSISIDKSGNLIFALASGDASGGDENPSAKTFEIKTSTNDLYVVAEGECSSLKVSVASGAEVEGDVYLVYGDAVVDGNVELNLSQGTFYGDINVVGSEVDTDNNTIEGGTVTGDVVVNLTGGTFYNDIYAGAYINYGYLGTDEYGNSIYGEYAEGTITGNVTVNLTGETATFAPSYYYSYNYEKEAGVYVNEDGIVYSLEELDEIYAIYEAAIADNGENYDGDFYYGEDTPEISGGDQNTGKDGNVATLYIDKYNTGNADLGSFEIENFDVITVSGASNVNAELEINRDLTMTITDNSNFYGSSLWQDNGTATITVDEGSSLAFGYMSMYSYDQQASLTINGDVSTTYFGMESYKYNEGTSQTLAADINGTLSISYDGSIDTDYATVYTEDGEDALININASNSSFEADDIVFELKNLSVLPEDGEDDNASNISLIGISNYYYDFDSTEQEYIKTYYDAGVTFEAGSIIANIENASLTVTADDGTMGSAGILYIDGKNSFTADSLTLNLTDVTSYADMYIINASADATVNIDSINVNVYGTLTMENNSSLNLSSGESLNSYGTVAGTVSVGAGASLSVTINSSNMGETLISSLTGEDCTLTINFGDNLYSLKDTSIYGASDIENLTIAYGENLDYDEDEDSYSITLASNLIYSVEVDSDGDITFALVGSADPDDETVYKEDAYAVGTDSADYDTSESTDNTTEISSSDTVFTGDTAYVISGDGSTNADESNIVFSDVIVFATGEDKVGIELGTNDYAIGGDIVFNTLDDSDDTLTAIKVTNSEGKVTFTDGANISAGNGIALTNEHSTGAGLNVTLQGSTKLKGDIVANSPFSLSGAGVETDVVYTGSFNSDDSVLTVIGSLTTYDDTNEATSDNNKITIENAGLDITGNIYTGGGDISVTDGAIKISGDIDTTESYLDSIGVTTSGNDTDANLSLNGSSLYATDSDINLGDTGDLSLRDSDISLVASSLTADELTADADSSITLSANSSGTMSSLALSSLGSISEDFSLIVQGSAAMLVGEDLIVVDGVDLSNNVVAGDYVEGTVDVDSSDTVFTLSSLSYFRETQASNANEMKLAIAFDSIEETSSATVNTELKEMKVAVESNGLDSYIMSSNSYIAEVNTLLLSNLNVANVNRSRELLQKAKGSYAVYSSDYAYNEAEYLKNARKISDENTNSVAQLQSINLLGSKDANNGVAGYDYWSVGALASIDEVFSDKLIAGVSLGGVYSKVEGEAGDNANSTAFLINLYSTFSPCENVEVFANLGYAHFWNEGSKGNASADWDSDAFNFLVGTSYAINTGVKGFKLSPLAMFNFVFLNSTDADYSNLVSVDSESYLSAKLILGLEAQYAISEKFNSIIRVMYSHEFGDESYDMTYGSTNGYISGIDYTGGEAGADSAVLGFGLSYDFSETCSAYFDYNAYIYESLITHSLNLSVALKF